MFQEIQSNTDLNDDDLNYVAVLTGHVGGLPALSHAHGDTII